MLSKADCGESAFTTTISSPSVANSAAGITGLSNQGLGRGLSLANDDQPGMFGALTFGGDGSTYSGPFRVRRC